MHRTTAILALAALAIGPVAADAARADTQCPQCRKSVGDDFKFCPYDGAAIRIACPACTREMQPDWRFCPFDGRALREGSAPAGEVATAAPDRPPAATPAPAPALLKPLDHEPGVRKIGNPMHAIDDLFRAIAARDEAWIRSLYRWERFFPDASPKDLDSQIDRYVKRLIERVRPTLEGRERSPTQIKLGAKDARIAIALRDKQSRAVVAEYEFTLEDDGGGWAIVAITP